MIKVIKQGHEIRNGSDRGEVHDMIDTQGRSHIILCPIFLTKREERQFDRVAIRCASNTERLLLEK